MTMAYPEEEIDKRSDHHTKTRDEQPSQRALKPSPGKNSGGADERPVHQEVRKTFETNDEPVRVVLGEQSETGRLPAQDARFYDGPLNEESVVITAA